VFELAKKEAKSHKAEKEEAKEHSHKAHKEEEAGHEHKHEHDDEKSAKKAAAHEGAHKQHKSAHSKQSQQYEWIDYKPHEIEEVIVNLANAGSTPSEIGMALRDQYGIPNVAKVTGEKLEKILEKHKLSGDVPRDLLNLIKKSVQLENHLQKNKKDFTAKRGYIITVSKIRKLVNYYHKSGKLSKDWRYTPERAALLIK
jgi:ribosomal protein S15P/S13E